MKKLFLLLSICALSCSTVAENDDQVSVQIDSTYDFRGIKVFAHRGFWNTAGSYENTLTSIKKAAEIRVHGVELDVRISSDSILYLFHDTNLKDGRIFGETTSAEIEQIVLPNGDKIPKVDEALQLIKQYPELLVNLEIKKNNPPGYNTILVNKLNDAVIHFDLSERVFFSSKKLSLLIKSKEYNPKVKTQFIARSEIAIQDAVDAKLDLISYNMYFIADNPSIIDVANAHNIEICGGSYTAATFILVLNSGLNIKYFNTDDPQNVMNLYNGK